MAYSKPVQIQLSTHDGTTVYPCTHIELQSAEITQADTKQPFSLEAADANAIEEVNFAYENVKEIECLDITKEGSEAWDADEERIDRVETRITAHLRDQIGIADQDGEKMAQALAMVADYNPFPTELEKIRSAVHSIFAHLREIRSTKYPIQRTLRLIEAISRDLSQQLLKVLGTRRLMHIPFDEFECVMNQCFEVFSCYDDEYDKLQGLVFEVEDSLVVEKQLDATIQIFINCLDRVTICMDASPFDSIYIIKQKVATKSGVPASLMRLFHCGELLRDKQILSQTKVKNNATISITLQLLGGTSEMNLILCDMDAVMYSMKVTPQTTIGSIKDSLEKLNSTFRKHKTEFKFHHVNLNNDCTLEFYNIKNNDAVIISLNSTIELIVVQASGVSSHLTTSVNATIPELKEQISMHTNIPPINQELKHKKKNITDLKVKLSEIGIEDLHVVSCRFVAQPSFFQRVMALPRRVFPVTPSTAEKKKL
ncbi:hypothetical protein HA402_009122 [Bradysia odoriphaga]|nr:hypothetical protein HA402_009122 [Bradysia odoriphaga]